MQPLDIDGFQVLLEIALHNGYLENVEDTLIPTEAGKSLVTK